MIACETSNNNVNDHFPEFRKMVDIGSKTKRDAYLAGQRAYEEFISGESIKEFNMSYSEYLDYWMKEYFEINTSIPQQKDIRNRLVISKRNQVIINYLK